MHIYARHDDVSFRQGHFCAAHQLSSPQDGNLIAGDSVTHPAARGLAGGD